MKTKKIISLTALALIASSTGASTVFAADGGVYSSDSTITYTPASGQLIQLIQVTQELQLILKAQKNLVPMVLSQLIMRRILILVRKKSLLLIKHILQQQQHSRIKQHVQTGSKLQIIVEHLLVGPFLFKPQNSQTEKQVQVLY